MTKIMLVEDDNNLREIYEARLLAEGYEIVSASDGEQALALAIKEKPDLIISDVMMPKISGFDMLDILRSTTETKNTKVIMMTALSQVEDKERADRLGADKYLVKSQVTLEDVAKVAREVIEGIGKPAEPAATISPAPSSSPDDTSAINTASTSVPQDNTVDPTTPVTPAPTDDIATPAAPQPPAPDPATATPTAIPVADIAVTQPSPQPLQPAATSQATTSADDQIASFIAQTPGSDSSATATTITPTTSPPAPDPVSSMPTVKQEASGGQRVLEPLHDISTSTPDLNVLLAEEEAREAMAGTAVGITPFVPAPTNPINDITPPPATPSASQQ